MSTARMASIAAAAALAVSAGIAATATQAAQAPPRLAVNGAVKPLIATCRYEATECAANEREPYRSLSEPVIGWGSLVLHAEGLGPAGVACTGSTFLGTVYNAHEGENLESPVRAYGLVEEFSTDEGPYHFKYDINSCSAPEFALRPVCGDADCEVYVSAEPPLTLDYREAEVCNGHHLFNGRYPEPLSDCPLPSERETEQVPYAAQRSRSTLPWKVELVRGYTASHEEVVQPRIGMASFGECGPGAAEGTETCSAATATGRCYQQGPSTTYSYADEPQGCVVLNVIVPEVPVEIPFFGSLETTIRNGAGDGTDPSRLEIEESVAGQLRSQEGLEGTGHVRTVCAVGCSIKLLGEEGQQLLTAK